MEKTLTQLWKSFDVGKLNLERWPDTIYAFDFTADGKRGARHKL